MKVLGKTPEGDLLIQVSQAEWDGLQDGIRPKDNNDAEEDERYFYGWPESEAGKLLSKARNLHGANSVRHAFAKGKIDGSIQSLRDIATGKIPIRNIAEGGCAKLKKLLDEQSK